jgi:hypothetical protein
LLLPLDIAESIVPAQGAYAFVFACTSPFFRTFVGAMPFLSVAMDSSRISHFSSGSSSDFLDVRVQVHEGLVAAGAA